MRKRVFVVGLLCLAQPVQAETTAYGYDMFGRLIGSGHLDGPSDGLRTDSNLDGADNRIAVNTYDVRLTLLPDQSIYSPDQRFRLIMQYDRNLVLYMGYTYLWQTQTYGSGASRATLQSDGNLVLYTSANVAVWHSATAGHVGASLNFQNDGNLVIYDVARRPVWATNTYGH